MDPVRSPQPQARLEDFRRKHRTGLVTLLFTDIVGSTQMKQALGEREGIALVQQQRSLVRDLLRRFPEGEEIETAGDSFLLLFATPSAAVKYALSFRTALRELSDPSAYQVENRMGIHAGEVFIEEHSEGAKPKDLYGLQVDICGRVLSLAQANQILLTRFAFDNARSVLRGEEIKGVGELRWMNHGPYLLKGVEESLEICEVGEVSAPLTPPANSEKAHRHVSADSEPVLGWRPALEQGVPGTEWVLEKKLGEGGFGEVWLGRHQTLKERRVFKFCFRADRVRSLKREVTLFRLLKERVGQHPNIVGVRDVYFDAPPFYLVMDYAEGQDLKAWSVERGGVDRIPLEERLEIVAQVADALEAAHQAGVIHRDVKPSNILISGTMTPLSISGGSTAIDSSAASHAIQSAVKPAHSKIHAKLTDFGIGQVVSQEALAGITRAGFTQTMMSPGSSSHTGTQLYMAPELFAGGPASSRSDIYSLGVVLYQLLIGDFARPLTTDWARKISDPLLRDDLEKCFAGNPEERFASAGDLATNLRFIEKRQTELAAGEKTVSRRRLARKAVIAAIILAVLTGGAIYAFKRGTLLPRDTREALGTKNPDAYDRYRRGQSYVVVNSRKEELESAVKWFQEAIELDPKFAQAYVDLAYVCHQLDSFWEPRKGWGAKALKAVNTALALDDKLAQAYVVRGAMFFSHAQGWNALSDVTDQRKALLLNPKIKNAHANLAFVYTHFGFEEALEELDQELAVDPFDLRSKWQKGLILRDQGQYPNALELLKSLPDGIYRDPRIKAWGIASCLIYLDQFDEASTVLQDYLTKLAEPDDALLLSTLAIIDAKRGASVNAREKIKKAEAGEDQLIHFHHVAHNIASAYALLGEEKLAVRFLEKAAKEGNPCYPVYKRDPHLQKLAGRPEFDSFMKQLFQQHERNRKTLLNVRP